MGTHWADEPECVAGGDDCQQLVAEDLADENHHQGRCLHVPAGGHRQGRRRMAQDSPQALPTLWEARMV